MSISKTRKSGSTTKSWVKAANSQCLTLNLRNGDSFILPYSQILWIKNSESQNEESITIQTGTHQIHISGNGLAELVSLLSQFQIEAVSERSARAEAVQATIISGINVTSDD